MFKAEVTVGEFDKRNDESGEFSVESRQFFTHPKYQSGNGMDWDACLIKVPS